jgi:hypothetical protein
MKRPRKWITVRKNLSKLLHISQDVLDFLSNYDIMLAGVSGYCPEDISKSLDVMVSDVRKTLLDNIGIYCDNWSGFEESSDINPYFIFRTLLKTLGKVPSEEEFSDEMQRMTGNASFLGEEYKKIYQIVSMFSTLRYKYLSKYRKEDYGNYLSRNTQETT